MNYLESEWTSYRETFGIDVDDIQIEDIKLAFYAGVASCHRALTVAGRDLSTENACKVIIEIESEVMEYMNKLRHG